LTPDTALADAVAGFVDEVGLVMEVIANQLEHVQADRVGDDVMLEAFNLSAAFIDCDGLETDDELWAFLAAFGPRYEGNLANATPKDIRASGMITGKHQMLDKPSALFEILLGVDARNASRHATTYYENALRIAHTVASLDAHVSRTELLAIERFRTLMLDAMQRAHAGGPPEAPGSTGGTPPGAPVTPGAPPAGTAPGATPPLTATQATSTTAPEAAPAAEALPPPRPLDELLAELDDLVGLAEVKTEVKLVANLLKVQKLREERNLPTLDTTRHLVFVGNPGTGKTTVARLVAQIYRTLGVVERGHLVETDRSGLVAGYVGQTATKVMAVFDEAHGGVLLIDEAYSLVRGGENDFGREAIDTVVKAMEDRRDSVVVIVAGYPDEMDAFLDANPGLRSRFPKTIEFPDYTTDELVGIFTSIAEDNHYTLGPGATDEVRAWLEAFPRGKGFGNGRLARNLFEHAVGKHATRIVTLDAPSDEQLTTLMPDDIAEPGEGPGHRPSPLDAASALEQSAHDREVDRLADLVIDEMVKDADGPPGGGP
jgi:hypothetical protein